MKQGTAEPIDFENVPRFRLGEQIQALTAQVEEIQGLASAAAPVKELQGLSNAISKLKVQLGGGGKVKKPRAPWGSKKKAAEKE